jgi:FlaA1/EpsC-like NDP-sugar epimerase
MSVSASESATPHLYAQAIATAHEDQLRATRAQLFCSVLSRVEIAADFLTSAAGMFAAYPLAVSLILPARLNTRRAKQLPQVLWSACLQRFFCNGTAPIAEVAACSRFIGRNALFGLPALSVLLLLAFSLLLDLRIPIPSLLTALIVIPVLLILQKLIFFSIIRNVHLMGFGIDRAVIYGAGNAGKRIVSALFQSPRHGLLPGGGHRR